MPREVRLIARLALIAIALVLEGGAIYTLATNPPADLAGVFTSISGLAGLATHTLGCALLAAGLGGMLPGGSASDRASVVLLYFVLAFILPVAGALGVIVVARLLSGGGIDAAQEGEFAIGNPLLEDVAHAHDAPVEAHLEPLVVSMRSFDTRTLGRMLLGLRPRAHKPGAAAILRRFQQDRDSEVQFYAQSALGAATEAVEARLEELRLRVDGDGEDSAARFALAELLLDISEHRTTTSADRERLSREALEQLMAAVERRPRSLRLHELIARAHLVLGDTVSARAALSAVPRPPFGRGSVCAVELETLYREGEWERLIEIARGESPADPALRASLAFWRDAESKRQAA